MTEADYMMVPFSWNKKTSLVFFIAFKGNTFFSYMEPKNK